MFLRHNSVAMGVDLDRDMNLLHQVAGDGEPPKGSPLRIQEFRDLVRSQSSASSFASRDADQCPPKERQASKFERMATKPQLEAIDRIPTHKAEEDEAPSVQLLHESRANSGSIGSNSQGQRTPQIMSFTSSNLNNQNKNLVNKTSNQITGGLSSHAHKRTLSLDVPEGGLPSCPNQAFPVCDIEPLLHPGDGRPDRVDQ